MSATRLALTTGCSISQPRTPAQRSSRHLARRCKNLLRWRRRSLPVLLPDAISTRSSDCALPNVRFGSSADKATLKGALSQRCPSRRTGAVKSAADRLDYLSGITISRSLVSTTKIASSFAGAVVLAFWLTARIESEPFPCCVGGTTQTVQLV